MKISGIYKITNKINGKYYVGSSDNIEKRFNTHKQHLKGNYHINSKLQNAWNKYGILAWEYVVVEIVNSNDLLMVEQKYLDIAKSEPDKTYNICFNSTAPMRGRTHTELSKIKMKKSSKHIGTKHTLETKLKQSILMKGKYSGNKNPMFGKNRSKENNPMFGKKHSKETIEKMKTLFIGKYCGDKNPMYNKHHTDKTKKLIINSLKDKTIYNLENKLTNEKYSGTQYDFRIKYNLLQGNVNALIRGVQNSVKGWVVV